MQVVCHQCGAKYEFDPSTIPSEGYDAECTSCKAVFFVAPEHGALITVTCEHCGTVYRFAASKIPAEGYDAQCTQCHKVFFVSTSRAVKPATKDVVSSVPPAAKEGEAPPSIEAPPRSSLVAGMGAALPSPMSPPPKPPPLAPMSAPPQLLADADKKVEPVSITPPAAPPAGEARVEEEPELEELTEVELLDDPPAPAALPAFQPEVAVKEPSPAFVPPPVAIEVEDDEDEAWPVRRGGRKVRSLVAALLMLGLVIVGGAAALGYFAPALFDATAGRVIGLRLTIPAAAVVALGRAQALVGNDTVESYDRALVDLRVALALHPDYADAAGYAAVVHVLKGLSRREAAMVERARSTRAREDLATLQTADPASTAALVEPLQRVVIEGGVRADRGLEQSQKDLERAATLADEALARYPSSAMANLAAGFVKAADGEAIAEGEALLARAVELLKGKGALLDLAHPPDVLTVYLRALLWAAVPEHKPRVRDALARVLELAPNFQKARFGLALELVEASAVEEAKGLLRTVVREVPGHTNAKTMLELLEAPRIEAPPPALEPDPEPAKAKKRKTKRRR